MKIAFLDYSGWNFSLFSPLMEPMGGSESAMCYLAAELGRLCEVTVFNSTAKPSDDCGVHFRHLSEALSPGGRLNEFDAVIVLNRAEGRDLRERLRVTIPLILWTQHDVDQPVMRPLIGRTEVDAWSAFVYVSNWQRERYEGYFQIPKDKGLVLRNAASPAFIEAEPSDPWFLTGKPPVLFYTSTPFRGLDVLLKAFPTIREATGATLKVFSSMSVYKAPQADPQFQPLYDQAKAMEGVKYIGSLGQLELAKQLSGAAALAYPSTFAETSCIAAIEAMALGCEVFTTKLGALPETTLDYGTTIDVGTDKDAVAANFADLVIKELREIDKHRGLADSWRKRRMSFVRDTYTWPQRAKEWASWLSTRVERKAEAAE